jgi:hypothetical protein
MSSEAQVLLYWYGPTPNRTASPYDGDFEQSLISRFLKRVKKREHMECRWGVEKSLPREEVRV